MNFCQAGIKISRTTNSTTIDFQQYLVSKGEIIHLNDSKKTKIHFRVTKWSLHSHITKMTKICNPRVEWVIYANLEGWDGLGTCHSKPPPQADEGHT